MFDTFQVKKNLYPLVSFCMSIVFMVCGFILSGDFWLYGFVAAVALLLICFGMGKPLIKVEAMMLVMGLIIGVLSLITSHKTTSFYQIVGGMLLMGVCSVPLVSTPPADLTRCMTQLKCPRALTLGMLITIRFIPIIVTEIQRIWEAMKVRGVKMALYRPDVLYRAFLVPLIMRLVGISDILSLSLETRGFNIEEKEATVYHRVQFHVRDTVFLVLSVVIIAGTFAVKGVIS